MPEVNPINTKAKEKKSTDVINVKNGEESDLDKDKDGDVDAKDLEQIKVKHKQTKSVSTSDVRLDKAGRKIRAHRIKFVNGMDNKKGVTEQMKKTFGQFVEQHTADLTEEQLAELEQELNEVLSKTASAGEWIHDFVHSDNPKFKGKSKEKRKQMALAAFYAKQRNEEVEIEEELKGNQHKLDKNKNGKLDAEDFKKLRKEEQEIDEAAPVDKTKPGWMLKADPELAKKVKANVDRAKEAKRVMNKYAGKMLNKEELEPILDALEEGWDDMVKAAKERGQAHNSKTSTMTKHDVKKTSTGTVYTKQRDADGMSKEFKRDNEGPAKRGRGRPKKNSFSEAVEFLMGLDEETFDSMMEEGFDAFMERYEQLDELSRDTLLSYANKVSLDSQKHSKDPTKRSGEKASRSVTGYARAHNRLEKPVK